MDRRIFQLQSDTLPPVRGLINPRKFYTFDKKQYLSLLLLLEEKGYKDGCGGSMADAAVSALLDLMSLGSSKAMTGNTPVPLVSDPKLRERNAYGVNKTNDGQISIDELRALIIKVCKTYQKKE